MEEPLQSYIPPPCVSRESSPTIESYSNDASSISENVITLVDSLGREFHTNLRASDLQYLVKYSIISSLRAELRNRDQNRKQFGDSRRQDSKTDTLLRGQNQPVPSDHSYSSNTGAPSSVVKDTRNVALGVGRGAKARNALLRGLKMKKCFQVLDDPLVQDLNDHLVTDAFDQDNGQQAEVSMSHKKNRLKKRLNKTKSPEDTFEFRKNFRGKRCRKVYGTEQRDKWCRQCKWKKSCARFADNNSGLDDSQDNSPPSSAQRQQGKTSGSLPPSPFPVSCDPAQPTD